MRRIAYKLLHVRKDGTLGPLFINRRLRVPIGEWLEAEFHPTPGFALRPGWHTSIAPEAPHLTMKDRAWFQVEVEEWYTLDRPGAQGGEWFISQWMRVLGPV